MYISRSHSRWLMLLVVCFVALSATAQGYKEVTSTYIKNADLAAADGWTYSRVTTADETKTWSQISKAYSGSYDSEIYAGDPQGYKSYEAYQTITLPRGSYHLIGRAFHRDAVGVTMYARQGEDEASVAVMSVHDQYNSSPASMDEAAKAFNANMYLNDLAFTVETDQAEVVIGYRGEFSAAKQWFIFGAFTLYQVQDGVSPSYPVDITPKLTRAYSKFSGVTGTYKKANIYIHEKYSESSLASGAQIQQTFRGLENGLYQVTINASASKANGVGSLPQKNAYVIAGRVRADVEVVERNNVETVDEYVLSDVEVTNGTLRVGLYNQSLGGNWLLFNVKSIKYLGTGDTDPVVTLNRNEPFSVGSSFVADVESDILLHAGRLNSLCLPFNLTAEQTAATFTKAYTLAGVEPDAAGTLVGQLLPADSLEAGKGYFVEVDNDRLFEASNVMLLTTPPDSLPVLWEDGAVEGHFGLSHLSKTYVLGDDGKLVYVDDAADQPGFVATVNLPAELVSQSSTITLRPVNFNDVQFTVNLENWRARRFINDNTYTAESASVVTTYNRPLPERRDQPHSVVVPIPASTASSLTLTLTSALGEEAFQVPSSATFSLFEVPNLIPQQKYSYKVVADDGKVLTSGQFQTTGRLRMIKADSGSNIRDLGGWQTSEGLRVRYGLVYRGGELNGAHVANAEDIKELRRLGIMAEVDLRENVDIADYDVNGSALGSDALYTYENLSRWSDDALLVDTHRFADAFNLVLKALREDRAAYFHCIWGADRTGCMAFLLEGLLGLPVDQLYKDYELTTFSIAGDREKTGLDAKFAYIQALPGATLQEQFYNYWHTGVGISRDDLMEFISRMVDGTPSILSAELPDVGVDPVLADADYYLRLPSLDRFLGRGGDYGTRAVADCYGVPASVRTNGFGVTTVRFLDNGLYLGSDGFTDKLPSYSSIKWAVEPVADGYVLRSSTGSYLQMFEGTRARIDAATADEATPITFLTAAEQRAIVAADNERRTLAVAEAAGIEASTLDEFKNVLSNDYVCQNKAVTIKAAYAGNADIWVLTEPELVQDYSGNYGNAYNVGNYGGELFQKHGTISQTVDIATPGLYCLSLNALYREGGNANCYALGEAGFELSNAYVSLGDSVFTQIPSWYSGCTSSTNPDNTDQARARMSAGAYAINLFTYVAEAGPLTITVHVPNFTPWGWCLFNNFALSRYVSKADGIIDVQQAGEGSASSFYDLSGRRLRTPRRPGIYILSGRKVVVP